MIHSRNVRPPDDRVTPGSSGYTEQRTFCPNGRVEFYKDGKLVGADTYRIEPKGAPASEARRYVLYVGESKQADGTVRQPGKLMVSPEILKIGYGMDGGCGTCEIFTRARAS